MTDVKPCTDCNTCPTETRGEYWCVQCAGKAKQQNKPEPARLNALHWNHRQISTRILRWAGDFKEQHGYHPRRIKITAHSRDALLPNMRSFIFGMRVDSDG